jgi:hypothetical protein
LFGGKRVLTEQDRIAIAVEAAAYVRWVETRQKKSPSDEAVDLYIKGALDRERLKGVANDVKMIAILALTMNVDLVHSYIAGTNFFERLDDATSRAR